MLVRKAIILDIVDENINMGEASALIVFGCIPFLNIIASIVIFLILIEEKYDNEDVYPIDFLKRILFLKDKPEEVDRRFN